MKRICSLINKTKKRELTYLRRLLIKKALLFGLRSS